MRASPSPLITIWSSRKPGIVALKILLILSASVASIASLGLIIDSFSVPHVYRKDFIQEYFLARAVTSDVDPYLSIPELALIFFGVVPAPLLNHPTPHPPPVVLLSLPFGLVDYQIASIFWFALECFTLFFSLLLLLRSLEIRRSWIFALTGTFFVFGWEPVLFEMVNGQLEIILLFFFVIVWLSLRKGWKKFAGIFLGVTIALKLFGWPILIYCAIKKNWNTVAAALSTFVLMNIVSGYVIGFGRWLNYYLEVSRLVVSLYRAYSANFSLYSIGWRTFEGTGSPILIGVEAGPLYKSPIAAALTSYLLPLMFLIFILFMVSKIKNPDIAYATLVSTSFLVNPIVWHHYLVIAILPAMIIGKYLITANSRRLTSTLFFIVIILLYIRHTMFYDLAYLIGGLQPNSGVSVHVSYWISLITLMPVLPVIGLIWLGWRLRDIDVNH